MLAVAVAAGSGLFSQLSVPYPFKDPLVAAIMAILLLTCFAFALLACKRNYQLELVRTSDSLAGNAPYWRRVTALTAVFTFLVFVLVQIYLVHRLTLANAIPAYWRSINFLSGVSGCSRKSS